jgi:hypothetical protein
MKLSRYKKYLILPIILIAPLPFITLCKSEILSLCESINRSASGILIGLIIGMVGILLSSFSNLYSGINKNKIINGKEIDELFTIIAQYRNTLKKQVMLLLTFYFILVFNHSLVQLLKILAETVLNKNLIPGETFFIYVNLAIYFYIIAIIFDIVISMFIIMETHSEVIKSTLKSPVNPSQL